MAEKKKQITKVWITTDQKTQPKPSPNGKGVVREKSSDSGRISESSVEQFRKGGTVHKYLCPSRKKSQEINKCYSQGPSKPHK